MKIENLSLNRDVMILEKELEALRKEANYDFESDSFTKSIRSQSGKKFPKVGDEAPLFVLPNEMGQDIYIKDLLKKGPVILSFFKGEWCAYCDVELKAMQRSLPEFQKHGATVLGISPHTVSISCQLKEKKQLTYNILSDSGNEIAEKYGLRFPMQDDLMNLFESFGLKDMVSIHGDQHENTNTLPIPGTFVINSDGKVIFSFVDSDHTKRAEPSDIVAALMSVA